MPIYPAFSGDRRMAETSGDDRDRTGNLRVANAALSQLSYVPKFGVKRQARFRSVYRLRIAILEFAFVWLAFSRIGRTWIRTKDLSLIRAAL